MTFPMTIVDTVFKALAAGDPRPRHRRPSRRPDERRHSTASTRGRANSSSAISGPLGGGWGAKRSEDGVSATVCINDGDTHNSPSEQVEAKFPVVVERYALVPDSGGAGAHRGGLGVERVVRARCADHLQQPDRPRRIASPGASTAAATATGNEVALRVDGAWKTDFPNAKVLLAPLEAGRRLSHALGRRRRLRRAAGSARSRRCRSDVRQGYVSVAAAAELYGVVLDPATFAIDADATAKKRAALKAAGAASSH